MANIVKRQTRNLPARVTRKSKSTSPRKEPDSAIKGAVVLATRGSSDSAAAALTARAIATKMARPLEVVSVVEPAFQYVLPPEMMTAVPMLDDEAVSRREEDINGPFARTLSSGPAWKASVRIGQPAAEVCDFARSIDATLIVVGASPHRRARRIIAGQRASQILHRSKLPVLSVAPWLKGLPKKVVAAIDFNPASLHAAEVALSTLESGGSLTLAHVIPPNYILPQPTREERALRAAIAAELQKIAEVLRKQAARGVRIETFLVEGDPVDELLKLTEKADADLLAIGTRGASSVERILIGSVATEIFHSALCSVLASPPPSVVDRARFDMALTGTASATDSKEFAALLDQFTTRNRGETVSVEEDDPVLGAQVQVSGYRLHGITFDKSDKQVEIMLGAPGSDGAHLTRTIPDVKSISVTGQPGSQTVQIVHGKSQTLLQVRKRA